MKCFVNFTILNKNSPMKRSFTILAVLAILASLQQMSAQESKQVYLELKIYEYENAAQEALIDDYLENAYLPALHKQGIESVGVFKPRPGEANAGTQVFVLHAHRDLAEIEKLRLRLLKDEKFQGKAADFLQAPHDKAAFSREKVILMQAFEGFPGLETPEFKSKREDRVYELRSYESATDHLYRRKVAMFNEGESEIFVRLGFQPVFFGDVIAGDKMPRLIYLTTHANADAQKKNWDAFRTDSKWEEMKVMERYANTVSHIDKWLLYPTPYSDY